MIQTTRVGRPVSRRVKADSALWRSVENVFRFAAAYRNEEVPDVRLKNWEESPELTRASYQSIPWRKLLSASAPQGSGSMLRGDRWRPPDWSTFRRYVVKQPEGGVPINRAEDFLVMAASLVWQIESDTSPDNRTTYLKRAIYRLRADLDTLGKEVEAARQTQDGLGAISAIIERGPSGPVREGLEGFSGRCRELAARIALDDHYVPLTLMTEERRPARGAGRIKDQYNDLIDVLRDVAGCPLLVLLGDPGSGKTTLMRRLYRYRLHGVSELGESVVPLLVSLGAIGSHRAADPEKLLSDAWEFAYGQDLPPLSDVSKRGKACLLLDGLNEASNAVTAAEWKSYLQERFLAVEGNMAVVSCRKFDYSLPLATEEGHVPHVRIAPLDPAGIAKYLERVDPLAGKELAKTILGDPRLTTLYGTPFFLRVLLDNTDGPRGIAPDRTGLLARLTWRLLSREYLRNPLAFQDPLFTQLDCVRIANSSGFEVAKRLPDDGGA